MPPPPSQAGKFKPRKPVKRASSAASASARPYVSSSAGGGRGIGRGGRSGRGGRKGRGRGRTPLPRGQVFFTGNAPPAANVKGGRGVGSGKSTGIGAGGDAMAKKPVKRVTIKMEGKHETSDEAIVGELEEAIGATLGGEKKTRILERGPRNNQSNFQEDAEPVINPAFSIAETYDSDSSRGSNTNSSKNKNRRRKMGNGNRFLQPSQLPFPKNIEPNNAMSFGESLSDEYKQEKNSNVSFPLPDTARSMEIDSKGQDSWYLFQFPTRLPVDDIQPPDEVSSEAASNEEEIPTALSVASEVSTPHLLKNSFDNTLAKCAGRMGKLIVYKSGKTVLAMGSTRLNVSEGLPCGFVQHATAIDTTRATFVPLGTVKKTVVVTPDIEGAFLKTS